MAIPKKRGDFKKNLMTILQIKIDNKVKTASHTQKQDKKTCAFCTNSEKIDIGGQKELRCKLIGTGINRKYRISPKDTCDKYNGSIAAFDLTKN